MSASFDIRPRRKFQYLSLTLGLTSFILAIVGETKIYGEKKHEAFCNGETDSSGAGTWGVLALLLLVVAFVSVISGPNECCNAVFCQRYGLKTFNSGLYLLFAWLLFIFGACCLYFGSIRELNHDCPKTFEDTYEVVVEGFLAAGGTLGFIAVILGTAYYNDSMKLAGLQAEKGLLQAKQKIIAGGNGEVPL